MRTELRLATVSRYVNSAIYAFLAMYFFLIPGVLVLVHLSDPNIRGEGIPDIAWQLHRDLTPRYAEWAEERVASGKAGNLNLYDVPSTEWPMFGSVYYLWATEALQKAWEKDNSLAREAPGAYARRAVEASVELIIDPVHHTWVKTHWGENYMHNENVFFRSLIIAGLTSYVNLTGDTKHNDLLRDQVDTLSAELDASPHGILEDYPFECYPIDVFATIACIQRADKALGMDHSAFISRSIRAFEGNLLDKLGLIPFMADDRTGGLLGPSRGTGNSYTLIFAPELWPDRSRDWYKRYEERFWQNKWWACGFREYAKEADSEFSDYLSARVFYDVDSGPIIAGFSPAANAFGLAAAKVNGRLDHAYTLASQVIAACWPLPDGSLFGPRILSSQGHAPYLGEACMLFFFAQQPHPSAELVRGGHMPGCVYIGLLFYFGIGSIFLLSALIGAARWMRNRESLRAPFPKIQFAVWLVLLASGSALVLFGPPGAGAIAILLATFLPRTRKNDQPGTHQ